MFESLNERMKTDENKATARERGIRWLVIILGVAVLLLGGLYIGLHYFQSS
jgi:hypothetical protein